MITRDILAYAALRPNEPAGVEIALHDGTQSTIFFPARWLAENFVASIPLCAGAEDIASAMIVAGPATMEN